MIPNPNGPWCFAREAIALTGPEIYDPMWAVAAEIAARNGELDESLALFGRALDGFAWVGEFTTIGVVLARIATLLVDQDPEVAAVLQGVADALAPGFHHDPRTFQAYERAIAVEDATLGAERRLSLHEQGRAMSYTDAVAFANAAINRSLAEGT